MEGDRTEVSDATRRAEEDEARAAHVADRPPTAAEEAAAAERGVDPEVAGREAEMIEIGAEVEGEGKIS